MSKPTLAFVDNSFHQKTRSGDLFRDLFAPHFDITNYWDASWENGPGVPTEELNRHEFVFFEQTFCPLSELPKLTGKILWAPMYDGMDDSWSFWRYLSRFPVKIIALSKKVHARAEVFGIPSMYVQYYANPDQYHTELPRSGRHAFFWYRGSLAWNKIKSFFPSGSFDSVIYRSNPDPSYHAERISEEDRRAHHMHLIEGGYGPKKEYLDLLSQTNIYIAPRKKEGIGLSFIEALAMGHVVIGCNDSTMNEYITDGSDGYLLNLKNPRTIDFSDFDTVQRRARERAREGFVHWEKSKPKIIEFVHSTYPPTRNNLFSTTIRVLHDLKTSARSWRRSVDRQKTKAKRFVDAHRT